MYFKILTLFVSLMCILDFSFGGSPDVYVECMQKFPNLKAEEVYGNFKTKGEIQDESNMDAKCAFLCVTTKNGMADEAGNIDVDKMKTKLTDVYSSKMKPDDVNALVDKCASRSETNPCDKVYQFHKCHMKAFLAM